MSATTERERATHMAPRDFHKALALARQVSAPWYRCQSLAWVARFAPDNDVAKVVEEAVSSAFAADDPYQTVGASAWPLRALIEREHGLKVASFLDKLIAASVAIENPVSRLDALYLLWQGIYPLSGQAEKSIRAAVIQACNSADSWKAGYILREIALVLAGKSLNEAERLVSSMSDGVYKRQAQRRIAEGNRGYIRPFFWQEEQHGEQSNQEQSKL